MASILLLMVVLTIAMVTSSLLLHGPQPLRVDKAEVESEIRRLYREPGRITALDHSRQARTAFEAQQRHGTASLQRIAIRESGKYNDYGRLVDVSCSVLRDGRPFREEWSLYYYYPKVRAAHPSQGPFSITLFEVY